jgi:hypothetical protein
VRRRALLALVAALALVVPAAAAAPGPGAAFEQILAAAKAGNSAAVWSSLTAATRAHYRSASAFAASPAGAELAAAARRPHRALVDEPFPSGGAVVAVTTSGAPYAGAMLREGGRWKLEFDPGVLVEPIAPRSGSVNAKVFQVAAQAMLADPVDTGAFYLDGKALDFRGAAVNGGRTVTLYANLPKGVARGRHTLVAYARSGAHAGALAWAFTVR